MAILKNRLVSNESIEENFPVILLIIKKPVNITNQCIMILSIQIN